jgi:hypothetical protein
MIVRTYIVGPVGTYLRSAPGPHPPVVVPLAAWTRLDVAPGGVEVVDTGIPYFDESRYLRLPPLWVWVGRLLLDRKCDDQR